MSKKEEGIKYLRTIAKKEHQASGGAYRYKKHYHSLEESLQRKGQSSRISKSEE